jgi:hypothetical protein
MHGGSEVKEEIQKHSRQYAKRQYTWLNHQMPVHWFEPDRSGRTGAHEGGDPGMEESELERVILLLGEDAGAAAGMPRCWSPGSAASAPMRSEGLARSGVGTSDPD